jgi:hypothetical protein
MNEVNGTRRSRNKPALVAEHLVKHGRITEGHALIEYGRFSVAHAVWELRHNKQHLLPAGKVIRTTMQKDVNGQPYALWELVDAEETRLAA